MGDWVDSLFEWWRGLPPIDWLDNSLLDQARQPSSAFIGVGIPILGAVASMYWRAFIHPDKKIYDVLFRPLIGFDGIDKVLVFDLLLAALISDIGFLTVHMREESAAILGALNLMWVLIAMLISGVYFIRKWGYEEGTGAADELPPLRQDRAIVIPNLVAFWLLVVVYNINT